MLSVSFCLSVLSFCIVCKPACPYNSKTILEIDIKREVGSCAVCTSALYFSGTTSCFSKSSSSVSLFKTCLYNSWSCKMNLYLSVFLFVIISFFILPQRFWRFWSSYCSFLNSSKIPTCGKCGTFKGFVFGFDWLVQFVFELLLEQQL